MNAEQQQALLSLALHAAYADGSVSAEEQAELRRVAERYGSVGVLPPSADAEVRMQTVRDLAARLRGPLTGLPAYEAAVAVCEADHPLVPEEQSFLQALRADLGLDETYARDVERQTDTWTTSEIPVVPGPTLPPVLGVAVPARLTAAADPGLDQTILNQAVLAGALELLPSTLATLAIVPLQMRLVYRVGKAYGYELDRGHIRDLLATVGVGLTSQVVEGFFGKVARGLLGQVAGGMGRAVGGQAASSGLSFITTYALGQMARQYYAGGRTFNAIELRGLYDTLAGQARGLQGRYLPQIQSEASRMQAGGLPAWLRQG